MSDKYPARIDDFNLKIETIDDAFPKAIAEHEFPFRDGALLQDMGQKAHSIIIRCYFSNDKYEDHKKFINHLQSREYFELVHPKYGVMQGCIRNVAVRHDDSVDNAVLDITFVENLRGNIESPVVYVNADKDCEEAYQRSISEQKTKFSTDMHSALGSEAKSILDKALDPNQDILTQFPGLSIKARNYVKAVDIYVQGLETTLNNIANPANSFISTIEFGVTLPGRVIGSVARTAERYSMLYESIKSAPTRFISSLKDGLTKLENSLGFTTHTQTARSSRLALDLGYIFSDDETKRQMARRLENVRAFTPVGKYVKTETSPVLMTVTEIEQTLYDVRIELQASIDANREMQSLKDMAFILQEHAYKVKIESEKLATYDAPDYMPLHLICLLHGLSYQYAERLHTVNRFKHPNFIRGDYKVYVR